MAKQNENKENKGGKTAPAKAPRKNISVKKPKTVEKTAPANLKRTGVRKNGCRKNTAPKNT